MVPVNENQVISGGASKVHAKSAVPRHRKYYDFVGIHAMLR
jgi:hypothetical protein